MNPRIQIFSLTLNKTSVDYHEEFVRYSDLEQPESNLFIS